jgi:hypothetical protein
MKHAILLGCVMMMAMVSNSQQKTDCIPVNIDYVYSPIPNFSEWGRHRTTRSVIVNYKGIIIFQQISGVLVE